MPSQRRHGVRTSTSSAADMSYRLPDPSATDRQFRRGQTCAVARGDKPETWTIRHFSQANPKGQGQSDVPALLRRVAETVESLGSIEVQDMTFAIEFTEDGPWPSLTVYFDEVEP